MPKPAANIAPAGGPVAPATRNGPMPLTRIESRMARPTPKRAASPGAITAPITAPTPLTAKINPISPPLNPSTRVMSSRTTAIITPENKFDVAVQKATARMRFSCQTNRSPSRMSVTRLVGLSPRSGTSAGVRITIRQRNDTA